MTNAGPAAADFAAATAATAAPGRLARLFGLIAVALALLSALATFMVLANLTPISPTHEVVLALLAFNAVTVLLLVGIIAWEIWRVVQARRRGRAGARLHWRIVALFSIVAALPAILVSVVASVTLDRGLDRLFSQQTQALIQNSLIVADAYLREQAQIVRADTIATAIEFARAKPLYDHDQTQFRQFVNAQAGIRGLPAVKMVDRDAKVVHQAEVEVDQVFIMPNARGAHHHRRAGTADRHVSRRSPHRRTDQAAGLSRQLSLRRAAA